MADPSLFIAGISGVLQAVQVWYASKSHTQAAEAFDQEFYSARVEPKVREEAYAISRVVPQDILDVIAARTQRCWTRYREVLMGEYLPAEIEEATEAVKRCICRELSNLFRLGEPMPHGKLDQWWREYCIPASSRSI